MQTQFGTHHYGNRFQLLQSPYLSGILARLCAPTTFQPQINQLTEILYSHLLRVVLDNEFPVQAYTAETRMTALQGSSVEKSNGGGLAGGASSGIGFLKGECIQSGQRAVVVNLARAGTFPSHICYHNLHFTLHADRIRQDHVFANRQAGAQNEVVGAHIGDTKIGGDVDRSIVLIPDPMGATGHTMISTLDHYKRNVGGKPEKFIAMHLIVTPEYLRKVQLAHPELQIYALRVDRGLSTLEILNTPLGLHWDRERGLNDRGYIIPGGGGFGEVMNNSFV